MSRFGECGRTRVPSFSVEICILAMASRRGSALFVAEKKIAVYAPGSGVTLVERFFQMVPSA